jgi:hypothetical protein
MADNTSFIFFLVRLVLRVHASVIFIGGYREENIKIQMITKETCTYVIHLGWSSIPSKLVKVLNQRFL